MRVVGQVVVGPGDDSSLHVAAQVDVALGAEEGDVIVVGASVVVGVVEDAVGGEHGAAAVGVGRADTDAPLAGGVSAVMLFDYVVSPHNMIYSIDIIYK